MAEPRPVRMPRQLRRYQAYCRRAHAFANETETVLQEIYPGVPLAEVVAWERVLRVLNERLEQCNRWLEASLRPQEGA